MNYFRKKELASDFLVMINSRTFDRAWCTVTITQRRGYRILVRPPLRRLRRTSSSCSGSSGRTRALCWSRRTRCGGLRCISRIIMLRIPGRFAPRCDTLSSLRIRYRCRLVRVLGEGRVRVWTRSGVRKSVRNTLNDRLKAKEKLTLYRLQRRVRQVWLSL